VAIYGVYDEQPEREFGGIRPLTASSTLKSEQLEQDV
jgi:hypothetical protein